MDLIMHNVTSPYCEWGAFELGSFDARNRKFVYEVSPELILSLSPLQGGFDRIVPGSLECRLCAASLISSDLWARRNAGGPTRNWLSSSSAMKTNSMSRTKMPRQSLYYSYPFKFMPPAVWFSQFGFPVNQFHNPKSRYIIFNLPDLASLQKGRIYRHTQLN